MTVSTIAGMIRDHADLGALERGRERMVHVAHNRRPDYLPIVLRVNDSPLFERLDQHNFKDEFYDVEKMLENQLNMLLGLVLAGGDAQLAMRVNLGAPFLATVFGLEVRVFEHCKPWLLEHLDRASFEKLDLEEILAHVADRGMMRRAVANYGRYQQALKGTGLTGMIHLYLPDTQGPFDLAHLVLGNRIFTELYDDPRFVHTLMEGCTQLYVRATRLLKESLGEELNHTYHQAAGARYYLANSGVRSCEDTTTLISPAAIDEFVAPYLRRAAQAFGGAFVHFCGRGQHLLQRLLDVPEVRGLNFGSPKNYDFGEVLPQLITHGKYYVGRIPRAPEESVQTYFTRVLGYLQGQRRGLMFRPDLDESLDVARARETRELWYELQDRYLN